MYIKAELVKFVGDIFQKGKTTPPVPFVKFINYFPITKLQDQCHKIPVDLYDILELDEKNLTVRVEPFVSVHTITAYLIPKGYALAVTLEIGDATCGGLALAVGMTTHSHKVGLYQENIVSYDIVLGDGSLVHATADNEYSDLFHCLPWSHGTLGFLVAVELKIIKVKPYVHMRYVPVRKMR